MEETFFFSSVLVDINTFEPKACDSSVADIATPNPRFLRQNYDLPWLVCWGHKSRETKKQQFVSAESPTMAHAHTYPYRKKQLLSCTITTCDTLGSCHFFLAGSGTCFNPPLVNWSSPILSLSLMISVGNMFNLKDKRLSNDRRWISVYHDPKFWGESLNTLQKSLKQSEHNNQLNGF